MTKYLYQLKNEIKQEVLSQMFKLYKLDFDEELQKACEYEFGACPEDDGNALDVTIYFDKSTLRLSRKEIKKTPFPRLKDKKLHRLLCEYDPQFPLSLLYAAEEAEERGFSKFTVGFGTRGEYTLMGDREDCVNEEEPDATK